MRKLFTSLLLILIISTLPLVARGSKESEIPMKTIRIAEQVPGLITPGIWDGQAFSLSSSIYEYLAEIDTDTGLLVPLLATDWSTDDGTHWTFSLRDDVTFHDGKPFNAYDVKFTIERTQDPAIGHLKKVDFEVVSSVEVLDDYRVRLTLKEPRPTFIYQLTDYNMAILSSEYDYAQRGEREPMGTGPFVLRQFTPKESALLVRNENYWDERYPLVDRLEIYFIGDIDAKVSMLESDQVDVVPFITPVIKNRLDANPNLRVFSPYQEQRFISMAVDMKPFDDNRVRLALKYTMDPVILARSVAQSELNQGFFYNETPIMNMLAEYHEIPLRGRDIEQAKSLLREAGYPNGVKVDLYYASDHPFGKELSQTIKELAAPAGFEINLKGYTRDVYLSQYWLKVPFSITGWGGRIDPSMLLLLAFHSQGAWNESHLKDPVVDKLIEKISTEPESEIRYGYYLELQEHFQAEGSLINIQVPLLIALNNRVLNYRHPLTMVPQYKYADIK